MAKALWNVRYRGAYNPGDSRDGVKQGMFWLTESGDRVEDEKRARAAADEWKRRNPDVHFIVAVWPAVLFDAEVLLPADIALVKGQQAENDRQEQIRESRRVAPIPATRQA